MFTNSFIDSGNNACCFSITVTGIWGVVNSFATESDRFQFVILVIWCYPLNDSFKSCFVSWFDAFGLAIIFRNIVIGGGSVRHIES